MNIFEWLANEKIEEAIRRGEFDNLPGKGMPLNLDDDSDVPQEMRLAHRIMKNAGISPPEISLRKELEALKTELARARTQQQRQSLEREVRLMCLRIAMLDDRNRTRRKTF